MPALVEVGGATDGRPRRTGLLSLPQAPMSATLTLLEPRPARVSEPRVQLFLISHSCASEVSTLGWEPSAVRSGTGAPLSGEQMTQLPMHSLHPVFIHFPIGILPLAVLADAVAAWRRDQRARLAGTVLWVFGLLAAAAAVGTGLWAYSRVEHSDFGHVAMTSHRNAAFAALAVLLTSALLRWWKPLSRVAAVVGALGVAGLAWAGFLGGEVVYRHGLGIPTTTLEQILKERGRAPDIQGEGGEMGPGASSPSAGLPADSALAPHDAPHDH